MWVRPFTSFPTFDKLSSEALESVASFLFIASLSYTLASHGNKITPLYPNTLCRISWPVSYFPLVLGASNFPTSASLKNYDEYVFRG